MLNENNKPSGVGEGLLCWCEPVVCVSYFVVGTSGVV